MIEIRLLQEEDMVDVLKMKLICWTEELNGYAKNTLSLEKEVNFWTTWMKESEKYDDDRLLIGAYEDGKLLGAGFASFAESSDIEQAGIELNGLWVQPDHRNKGISLAIIKDILDYYDRYNMKEIVIYNPKYAPSNTFYKKFGCRVKRTMTQLNGKLPVDIFYGDIRPLKYAIEKSLEKYLPISFLENN
jgi:GNAT superfamily N-acetyltransferase